MVPQLNFTAALFSCARGSVLIRQCATVAGRETWTRTGGRYFGLSGSVMSDCAEPLSALLGVIVQSGVGAASTDRGGAPQWEKGPITLSACGLRTGDCGDGLVLVVSPEMSISSSRLGSCSCFSQMLRFHLFPSPLDVVWFVTSAVLKSTSEFLLLVQPPDPGPTCLTR